MNHFVLWKLLIVCFIQGFPLGFNSSASAEDKPLTPPPVPQANHNFQQPPPSLPPTAPPAKVQHDKFINNIPVINPGRNSNTLKAKPASAASQPVQLMVKPTQKDVKTETKSIQLNLSEQKLDSNPGIPLKTINPLPPPKKKTRNPVNQKQKQVTP